MACRLFGAKPLFKLMLGYYQVDPYKLHRHFYSKICIHENASENTVCEMAVILSRGEMIYSF